MFHMHAQDMPLLGLTPSAISYASDHFASMATDATALVATGFLYADDTPVDEVRLGIGRLQHARTHARMPARPFHAWPKELIGAVRRLPSPTPDAAAAHGEAAVARARPARGGQPGGVAGDAGR